MLSGMKKLVKDRKGQGLLEYAFLIAGIAFIGLVPISVFGHKLSDQFAIAAGMLPCGHAEDNLPIATSEFASFADDGNGVLIGTGESSWTDVTGIAAGAGQENNVIVAGGAGTADAEAFVAD